MGTFTSVYLKERIICEQCRVPYREGYEVVTSDRVIMDLCFDCYAKKVEEQKNEDLKNSI